LLGNRFVFYVDHMVLVYLVNKPQVSSKLTIWVLLFLEYDFKIVYKPNRYHLMADALNQLPYKFEPFGIPNQTCDVDLFTLSTRVVTKWFWIVVKRSDVKDIITSQRQYLSQWIKPFVFEERILYQFGQDNKFCEVLQP